MALVKWNLAAPHGVRYVNEWRGDCTLEFEEGREQEIFQDIIAQMNMHLSQHQRRIAAAAARAAPANNPGVIAAQPQNGGTQIKLPKGLPTLRIDDEGNVTTTDNPGSPGGQKNG